MLYRIDLTYPDGRTSALSDFLGPRLIRSYHAARSAAVAAANEILDEAGGMPDAQLSRIGRAGRLSVAGHVRAGTDTLRKGAIHGA